MILEIEMGLPFKLPIEDNTQIVSSYNNKDFKVVFKQQEQKYRIGFNEGYNIFENTIAIIHYCNGIKIDDKNMISGNIDIAVIDSIKYLNNFINALRFSMNDRKIRNFTITDLDELINVKYNNEVYGYVTNPVDNIIIRKNAQDKDIYNALNILSTWERYPEIAVVDKFFDIAKHHLANEEFLFSIIELQTSFEVFIRNSFRIILLKNKEDENEVNRKLQLPFRNIIEQHLAKQLKVNLDFEKEKHINQWYKNLYLLRNEIVHSGMSEVNGSMAYKAYDSYVETRNYISDLLVNRGYLDRDGKINLKKFYKNTKQNVDEGLVREKLIEKGFLDPHVKFVDCK